MMPPVLRKRRCRVSGLPCRIRAGGGAEGAGQDREHDVEIDVEQDGTGERVEAEGLDGFGEALSGVHPPGVGLDDLAGGQGGPVRDEQDGLVVAQPGDGELADGAGIGRQLCGYLVCLRAERGRSGPRSLGNLGNPEAGSRGVSPVPGEGYRERGCSQR